MEWRMIRRRNKRRGRKVRSMGGEGREREGEEEGKKGRN